LLEHQSGGGKQVTVVLKRGNDGKLGKRQNARGKGANEKKNTTARERFLCTRGTRKVSLMTQGEKGGMINTRGGRRNQIRPPGLNRRKGMSRSIELQKHRLGNPHSFQTRVEVHGKGKRILIKKRARGWAAWRGISNRVLLRHFGPLAVIIQFCLLHEQSFNGESGEREGRVRRAPVCLPSPRSDQKTSADSPMLEEKGREGDRRSARIKGGSHSDGTGPPVRRESLSLKRKGPGVCMFPKGGEKKKRGDEEAIRNAMEINTGK